MSGFFFSGEDIAGLKKEVDDAKALATPTAEQNETFKAGAKEGEGRWSEVAIIKETSFKAGTKKNPNSKTEWMAVIKMELQRADEGGCDLPNGGRIHTAFIYLNTEDRKDPKKGRFFAQKFGVLNSLLVAAGLDTSQGVDFEEYLDGDQPLMGQKVLVSFNKSSYVDKSTKEVVSKFEETGFFPFAQSTE